MNNTSIAANALTGYADNILSVSTSHISLKTAEALGQPGTNLQQTVLWRHLNVRWHECGWIIACACELPEQQSQDYPELAALISDCKEAEITFLHLDRDAPVLTGWPTFEW